MRLRNVCGFLLLAGLVTQTCFCEVGAEDPETVDRTLCVRVIDVQGGAVSGAEISRSVWTDQKNFDRNEKFVTDADGIAEVTLPESMQILRLWIRQDGFAQLFANWSRDEIEEVPTELDVKILRGTKIGGSIVNQAGDPIRDAHVEVRYRGGGLSANTGSTIEYSSGLAQGNEAARTNDQGRWTVSNVPPGDDVVLSLKIAHPEYIQDEYWGQLQAVCGVTTSQLRHQTAEITMTPGNVARGLVADPKGNAIPGVLVTWSRDDNWSVWDNKLKADDEGSFELPPMTTGTLFLAVAANGWKPQLREMELTSESKQVKFVLEPGNSLRLRVLDTDGNPIPKANVVIEQWGGVRSGIIGGECKLFDGTCPAKADENGNYEWKSAPDETVRLRLSKKGFSSLETELVPGSEVHTITLQQAVVISGKVMDDATGQLIDNVQLIPVSHYPQRPDDPIVQRSQIRVLSGGEFSHTESGWNRGQELILQFESMGYRPQRIGPFNPMSGKVHRDVRLERASPLRGRVVGTDGQPVADAVVSFTTKDTSLIVSQWDYERDGLSTRTDADGDFEFIATMSPPVIIATHESGYAEVALDLDQQPGTLRLRPWSRVEGRLMQAGKPVVGNRIYLRPIRMLGGDNPHVQDSFSAQTDMAGKFHFDRVPPVPSSLAPYLSVWEECQLTSSYYAPLDLRPGETQTVKIGEEGVLVRGQVIPSGDLASKLDMNFCLNFLLKRAPGITPPEPIARAGFDWRKGWSLDFRNSQEGRGFLKTLHHHFVKFGPDGTFTINGVTEGAYQFAISIYEPPEGCLIDPVGLDVKSFNVGSVDLQRGELDLGVIEVEVSLGPQVGEPFPNFRYESVNEEEVRNMSELRGRYALIDFWATWCAPCVKTIPELKEVAKRFDSDRVVVLSVSLDEQLDHARKFITDQNMDWPQALLGKRDNPIVRQQLGISSVPIYYVLDPNGKLIHRSFQLKDAVDALEAEMADGETK